MNDEYFIDGLEIIAKEYTKLCPECYNKIFSKKLLKSPKMIHDEGPHYRLLIDIKYLDAKYYLKKHPINILLISLIIFRNFIGRI